jgi:hypothetical protein
MSRPEFDEMSGGKHKKSCASQTQLASIAESFFELFKLLEQHAPVWYAEEHHYRAVAALRVLQEAGLVKEAGRSQKAS